jgi:putative peptide zinc metalloprotease protein
MPAEWQYSDSDCEILLVGARATVLDRSRNRYYQTTAEKLPPEILAAASPRVSQVSGPTVMIFLALVVLLLAGNFIFSLTHGNERPTSWLVLVLAIYLPLSVLLHEMAHALALKAMGRSIDKFGFKLNYWIFPAFYVRMNQSLLLSRNEKVIVHGAGVATNLAINLALFAANVFAWNWSDLEVALQFVLITLAVNTIPALKSDGYRVILALANVDEVRGFWRNPWWLIAIKILSIGYVLYYSFHMLTSLMMRI